MIYVGQNISVATAKSGALAGAIMGAYYRWRWVDRTRGAQKPQDEVEQRAWRLFGWCGQTPQARQRVESGQAPSSPAKAPSFTGLCRGPKHANLNLCPDLSIYSFRSEWERSDWKRWRRKAPIRPRWLRHGLKLASAARRLLSRAQASPPRMASTQVQLNTPTAP